MNCTCPKCSSNIPLELETVPEEGVFVKCSGCNGSFQVVRESFAGRALRRSGEIFCVHCGKGIGASICCTGCGAIYPDYFVVESATAAGKQAKKLLARLNVFKGISLGRTKQETVSVAYTPGSTAAGAKAGGRRMSPVVLALFALIVVALLAGGGVFYYQQQKEADYADLYIKALYGVKAGTDFNLKYCAKIAADWKKSMEGGQAAMPRLTPAEQALLRSSRTEVDKRLQSADNPPEKFAKNNDALKKLYEVYKKSYTLVSAPADNLTTYTDSASKLTAEFAKAGQELKTGLPDKLSDALAKGKQKYRELKEF